MKKPQTRIYGAVWFTLSNTLIGIVTMNNGYEDKAYIGLASGLSEEGDTQQILKYGAKFPFKQAIELTGKGKISREEEEKMNKIIKAEETVDELEKDFATIICDTCKSKPILQTANFGGKFYCGICGKLQTMVPSAGHGKVCNDCVKKGYCKYCGKNI